MFGISFEELIVLLVLALILFGPEKLPEYSAKLGYWLAKLRQAGTELAREIHTFQYHDPPLPRREPFCPHCGQKVRHDFAFCPHCGQQLNTFKETKSPLAS